MDNGLVDGLNYLNTNSEVTLVLDAPGKEYVYVVGSFNNYSQDENYLMKRTRIMVSFG